jgi:hypothetical protein
LNWSSLFVPLTQERTDPKTKAVFVTRLFSSQGKQMFVLSQEKRSAYLLWIL